jgi:DNA polymerase-3 subunit alpha
MYLNCHTYYSLRYGTISPTQLLDLAESHGVKQLVLTDINNTSCILDTIRLGNKRGIKIVAGLDIRHGVLQQCIAIAKNNEGFAEMNRYLSEEKKENDKPLLPNCYIIYPFDKTKKPTPLQPNEYLGLKPEQINHLPFTEWKNNTHKMVVLQPVSFTDKKSFNAHRILRAIANNALLSQLPKTEQGNANEVMLPENELIERFAQYPHIIHNTRHILNSCESILPAFQKLQHNNQQSYTTSENLDFRFMKHLAYSGLHYRYPEVSEAIKQRIEKELVIIRQKGFVAYFLIAWRVTKYARKQGYFYVGRGSGANSIISYLLRITDVDPMELDLYFERFINLFRKSPPDFDIDFSWKDREDVTRYIFNRFPYVALLAAYSTFKGKSIIREIGKTFGLPDHEIKQLQQHQKPQDDMGILVLRYAYILQGFPSHLTVHSAGIIIAKQPIHYYTATFMPPKGFPTTHFDMHIAEDIALYKFDILGQRGLAKVKDALKIIKQTKGIEVDIHNMKKLKLDKPSNDLLRKGEAIACFYVESPAMRMLLMKLKVADYLGLVAASSVIRPGVAQSGMMREYILRHRSPERRAQAKEQYPTLYNLMPDTYGVMVYQEDVIKVAHYFAGLTLAEADVLRRGMSGKYRSREEFQDVRDKFFANCTEKKISATHAQEVWTQIESFAGYAFAKGHSASYAVESYQCLYLKAHYPLEFLVATVNNGGGFYSQEVYLHEASKHGAIIKTPCVNHSQALASLHNNTIYIGLASIDHLESTSIQNILVERRQNGGYSNLRDFILRASVSLEQLVLLIRAHAFDFTQKGKKELLWDAHFMLKKHKNNTQKATLFQPEVKAFKLPPLWQHTFENAFDQLELLGHMVTYSPFDLVKKLPPFTFVANDYQHHVNQMVKLNAYLVHVKHTSTKSGERMFFGTFIDTEGNWIDTVTFPQIALQYPFLGKGCYSLHGKVTEEFGFYSIEVHQHKKLTYWSLDDEDTKVKQLNITNRMIG